jgi:hypothetical protein
MLALLLTILFSFFGGGKLMPLSFAKRIAYADVIIKGKAIAIDSAGYTVAIEESIFGTKEQKSLYVTFSLRRNPDLFRHDFTYPPELNKTMLFTLKYNNQKLAPFYHSHGVDSYTDTTQQLLMVTECNGNYGWKSYDVVRAAIIKLKARVATSNEVFTSKFYYHKNIHKQPRTNEKSDTLLYNCMIKELNPLVPEKM